MKTLLVTQDFPPRPGGMSRYYADLARGLGEDCTVATGTWEGMSPHRRGRHRMLTLPFDAAASHRPWNLFRTSRELDARLRRDRPDALVGGNIRPFGLLTERLARRHRLPLALIYHGSDLLRTSRKWKNNPLKRRRWDRLVRADGVHVVNSRFTAGIAVRVGFPEERIAIVPPEVDTAHFHPPRNGQERRRLRERRGWNQSEIITLFAGRLINRKGLEDLFTALRELPAHVRLVVAGSGDADVWEERARDLGVGNRVEMVGSIDYEDLPELYGAADIFAGPSRDMESESDVESFGIVFLEASATGLPVLATRTGGIPESVEDGVGGILVSPRDPDELARAWLRLAEDDALRRRLGKGGREGRAASHGPGSSARRLLEVLGTGSGS